MDSYDIVQAGAPALGASLWYRIVEQHFGFFTIEIRELRDFFGSRLIAKAQSYPNETTADIAAVARRAVERMP
ncbi:hypothetical protein ACFPA8_07775 [Streptomyces ovatisporus]|uniref:Uncharacterized protein n=1 Tax=Streptomyces ovatisporus TaxID=1128682 RepID=A0ABV9A370_9ACTN